MLKPGMFVNDRYEIIDKIGTGGMADVYKARCHRLNRFVAIKVLKQEYSEDMKFVEKFRGEAQSAAGLSHPNIVNVYDVGEDDGLYYIVMELVEGITLKTFIERKGKLEVKEAVGICIQIALGMEAAHDNHIIHRDIKPQNIIISREGKVKVTDFGIAKAASSNTITSNAMGSVHYISPEQARGGYSDEKSDIYSLGITLYEMLCGKVPFIGDNTVSVALSHIQEEAVSLRNLDPNIPVSLDRIVQKCMQKKPERRYLSVSALITDLRQSITNPDGDFVKIAPMVMTDSPTINLSDQDISHIKNAAKIPVEASYATPTQAPSRDVEEPEEDDEEDDSDVDPKLEKLMVIGSVAVAIILVFIIVYIVGTGLGLFGGSKKEKTPSPSPSATVETEEPKVSETPIVDATVPKVIGMTLEEAQAELSKYNLTARFTKEESDLFAEGLVFRQSPESGESFKEGDVVELVVSSGATSFSLSDVYGKPKNEADTILEDAGLVVAHEYAYSDTVAVDSVISTTPAKGTSVYKGDKVTILLSKGPETKYVYVPGLSNLTEKAALNKLSAAGLTKGKITHTYSDRIEEGLVISQSVTVDTQVVEGTKVDFTVSLGVEEEEPTEYAGSVTINYNPFEYEDEEGTIKLVLTQDGKSKTVYESVATYDSFPLTVDLLVENGSDGTINMYLDGVKTGESYLISFTKVGE